MSFSDSFYRRHRRNLGKYIGVLLGVAALSAFWWWLSQIGPRKVEFVDLPAEPTPIAMEHLRESSDSEPTVLLSQPRPVVNPARSAEEARIWQGEIVAALLAGDAALANFEVETARIAYSRGLSLQRAINQSQEAGRYRNIVREAELDQRLRSIAAAPLAKQMSLAEARARAALSEEAWSVARDAFGQALGFQERLNRQYANTRFSSMGHALELEQELQSLDAADLAVEISQLLTKAERAAATGELEVAGQAYRDAASRQRQINIDYRRSKFVDATAVDDYVRLSQTTEASAALAAVATLDRQLTELLRTRQAVAAERVISEAQGAVEDVYARFPRGNDMPEMVRRKLGYLARQIGNLSVVQDLAYAQLVPLPGIPERFLLRSEVSQAMYTSVMTTNPSRERNPEMPVDSVTCTDAELYCQRLAWTLGRPVRLPTEDEFRIALGAGDGDVWVGPTAKGSPRATTEGTRSGAGFLNLRGNLAEWVRLADGGSAVAGGNYREPTAPEGDDVIVKRDAESRARTIGFRFIVEMAP